MSIISSLLTAKSHIARVKHIEYARHIKLIRSPKADTREAVS